VYRFNLQVVLDYRKLVEEKLQVELSEVERSLERAKQMLFSYERKKSSCAGELKRMEEKAIDVDTALLYRNYLKGIRIKISEQRDAVATIKIALEKKREELLSATTKKKIMEKIKEKGRSTYVVEQEKKERIIMDETAIKKYQVSCLRKKL
jgi:flagellar FliJ protein